MLGLERPRQSSGYTDVHRLCHHHLECGLTSSLGPYAGQYDSDLCAIDLCHVGRAGGPSGATESTHPAPKRSEEHTSELQSPMYLVCRLLLEKKNEKTPLQK